MKSGELKELIALNTLVFETLGQPEKERNFNFKTLKRWGLDLLKGKKQGTETYFTSEFGKHKKGDVYDEEQTHFEVTEVLKDLPKNTKIYAHIEMVNGRSFLVAQLRQGEQNIEIVRMPVSSVLMTYCKKHKLNHLAAAISNVGTAVELTKHQGQQGKPVPYDQLPDAARRFLREAKKIEKETGFGRIALSYFGKNKDGDTRYRLSWLLPTIAIFELDIAEKVDKLLGVFK
jgi:uncharacterized protein (TIGR00703 family)